MPLSDKINIISATIQVVALMIQIGAVVVTCYLNRKTAKVLKQIKEIRAEMLEKC